MPADGRFAPSPTGPLHLGSLRTALVAWLFARSQSASFRLRVEDLDPERSRPEFEAGQKADLRALGIDWDGPAVRQSERTDLYEAALARLRDEDRLYPCFCTRAEIRDAASAPHADCPQNAYPDGDCPQNAYPHGDYPHDADPHADCPQNPYPGTCRELTAAERRARERSGRPFALRLRAGGERIQFHDRLLGHRAAPVDDFVVRRTDGVPAYQLAVVVDDAAQRIGEVVRGADLLSSTPRQILLARLLGLPVPGFAHVPLVLGADGTRLAKRHGPVTLADRPEPPAAVLALLAHSLGMATGRARVSSPAELLSEFDPDRLPRAPGPLP